MVRKAFHEILFVCANYCAHFVKLLIDVTLTNSLTYHYPLDQLVYAAKVKKTNMFEWTQERTLVITNNALYNIHKKSIKRVIEFKDIIGMTKTVPPSKNVAEFTVHVGGDTAYDYRFITEKREEIMNIIKRVYHFNKKTNIPVYHTDAKDLRTYTTTEKDWKSGRTNFPPQNLRATEEDLFQGAGGEEKEDESNTFENEASLAAASAVRGQQIKGVAVSAEESGEDEIDQ